MKALLVANPFKERAGALAAQMRTFLSGRCELVPEEESVGESLEECGADFAVVFGGDGTVLHTVARLGARQIPLVTVNLGRLGFLAEITPDEVESALLRVLAGQAVVSHRMMLQGRVLREDEVRWCGHCLNEFAFLPSGQGRMSRLRLTVDASGLTEIAGDGLLLSTPTGSTGYAMSAGGPILSPELEAMLLVPVCPHRLSHRPLVFSRNESVCVRGRGNLTCDGRKVVELTEEDRTEVACSQLYAQLVVGDCCGRYDILRRKLGWGE